MNRWAVFPLLSVLAAGPCRAGLPLVFEPNVGQTDPRVRFLSRGPGYTLHLTGREAVLSRNGASVRLELAGARTAPPAEPLDPLPSVSHYLRGGDPSAWRTGVPHYRKVRFRGVYPGVDLVYYGRDGALEFDFVVAPGGDPDRIRMRVAGARGMRLAPDGDLTIETEAGTLTQRAPRVFQRIGGREIERSGRYRLLEGGAITFTLGRYDKRHALVIDPILNYATYLGGTYADSVYDVAADNSGNAYLTGWTESPEYPTAAAVQPGYTGQRDAFVTKLNSTGTAVVYSTYIGGAQLDEGNRIVVDAFGSAYVCGRTWSTDFPATPGAFQRTNGGATPIDEGFVLKLNPAGSQLVYSTYLGGSNADSALGLAVDNIGSAYVSGTTRSANFPVLNPLRAALAPAAEESFLVRLNPQGTGLLYGTYIDTSNATVAADSQGNAYVAGSRCAPAPAPAPAAANIGLRGGVSDIYVAKVNPAGTAFLYQTCAGGSGAETVGRIAVDPLGAVYLTGATNSANFPLQNPAQPFYGGTDLVLGDAYAMKLSPDGSQLAFSTFLGGDKEDHGQAIAADITGSAYVTGITKSTNFPTPTGAPAPVSTYAGFLARLDRTGATLLHTIFFDGADPADRTSVAVNLRGGVYLAGGTTQFTVFPSATTPPLYPFRGVLRDGFAAKVANANLAFSLASIARAGANVTVTGRLNNRGPDRAENASVRGLLPGLLTVTGCSSPGQVCVTTPSSITINTNSLLAGQSIDFNVTAQLAGALASGTLVPTSFRAASNTHDPRLAENTASPFFQINENSAACSFGVGAPSRVQGAPVETYSVLVNTAAGCSWFGHADVPWITFTTGSGTGPGFAIYTLAPNPEPGARSGLATVAGQGIPVIQRGAAAQPVFNDVPATHPYFDHVGQMRQYGITAGCTETDFCPDSNTTRSQVAVFLMRAALGGDDFAFPATPYFTDVPSTHPHFRWVQKMREFGITQGCTATEFCPDQQVTRGQLATFLIRARAGQPLPGFSQPAAASFIDVPVGHPFAPFIEEMRRLGITTGCTASAFCPDGLATRGQVAVFLIRGFFAP